jgi:hypothetical protein
MKDLVENSRPVKDERRELKGTAQWNFICGPNIPMGYSIKPYSLICVTQCIRLMTGLALICRPGQRRLDKASHFAKELEDLATARGCRETFKRIEKRAESVYYSLGWTFVFRLVFIGGCCALM